MLLGSEIKKAIELDKTIIINPYDVKNINPNSYNVTLNNKLLMYELHDISGKIADKCVPTHNNGCVLGLDLKSENKTTEIIIPEEGIILLPGILYLGQTNEYTSTSNYIPMLEGRSSIGRMGIDVHVTAGFGDIGFSGYWTLEIRVIHPVKIYPNIKIGQIAFHKPDGIITKDILYNGKYQMNKGVEAGKLYTELK